MFNLTTEVIILFISVIPTYFSVILLYKQYRKYPDYVLLIMTLAWLSYSLHNTVTAISYLFLSKKIWLIRGVLLAIFLLLVEIGMSYINAGKLNRIRLSLIAILSAALSYSLILDPVTQMSFPNSDKSLAAAGAYRNISIIAISYIIILYTYYTYKIYKYSDFTLKYFAKINFIGALVLGPLAFITFLSMINRIIPGITEVFFGIGVLISAWAFSKRPELLYVLPFKAIKLIVIKEGSGLAVYDYKWVKDELDVKAPLFSSAVESINSFSRSAIDKGNITEITFEDGILLLQTPKNQGLYYALLATKSSYTLKVGLKNFATMFYSRYHSLIEAQFVVETSSLKEADELISQCFPYVPMSG